jgi:hypothetical protein
LQPHLLTFYQHDHQYKDKRYLKPTMKYCKFMITNPAKNDKTNSFYQIFHLICRNGMALTPMLKTLPLSVYEISGTLLW